LLSFEAGEATGMTMLHNDTMRDVDRIY